MELRLGSGRFSRDLEHRRTTSKGKTDPEALLANSNQTCRWIWAMVGFRISESSSLVEGAPSAGFRPVERVLRNETFARFKSTWPR